jgi:hypothetical protein
MNFNPEFKAEFILEDARRDIVRLRGTGDLDAMKLSKVAFAKRWRVPRSTAWTWLQKFQAAGLIDSVATGTRNATVIRGASTVARGGASRTNYGQAAGHHGQPWATNTCRQINPSGDRPNATSL